MTPDPVTLILGGAGAGGAWLLGKILEPTATDVGEALRDRIRLLRAAGVQRTLARAEQMVRASGRDPHPIASKAFVRILEDASLEDDAQLQEQWAALLANAALGNDRGGAALYARILSQLTPLAAAVLDAIRQGPLPGFKVVPAQAPEIAIRRALFERMPRSAEVDLELTLDLLFSLGLVHRGGAMGVTTLGARFLAACEPPAAHP